MKKRKYVKIFFLVVCGYIGSTVGILILQPIAKSFGFYAQGPQVDMNTAFDSSVEGKKVSKDGGGFVYTPMTPPAEAVNTASNPTLAQGAFHLLSAAAYLSTLIQELLLQDPTSDTSPGYSVRVGANSGTSEKAPVGNT